MVAFYPQYNSYNPYQAQQQRSYGPYDSYQNGQPFYNPYGRQQNNPYNPYQQQQPYSNPNTPRQLLEGQFMQPLAYQPFGRPQNNPYNPYQQQQPYGDPYTPGQIFLGRFPQPWQPQKPVVNGLISQDEINKIVSQAMREDNSDLKPNDPKIADIMDNGFLDGSNGLGPAYKDTLDRYIADRDPRTSADLFDNGFVDGSAHAKDPRITPLMRQPYGDLIVDLNRRNLQFTVTDYLINNAPKVKENPELKQALEHKKAQFAINLNFLKNDLEIRQNVDNFMFENRENPLIRDIADLEAQRRYLSEKTESRMQSMDVISYIGAQANPNSNFSKAAEQRWNMLNDQIRIIDGIRLAIQNQLEKVITFIDPDFFKNKEAQKPADSSF